MSDCLGWPKLKDAACGSVRAVDDAACEPLAAVITLPNGRWQTGVLIQMDVTAGFIEFLPKRGTAVVRLALDSINSVRLAAPITRSAVLTQKCASGSESTRSPIQKCRVFFRQGLPMVADAARCIAEPHGLFLFWMSHADRAWRWFIPASAVDYYQVGDSPEKLLLVAEAGAGDRNFGRECFDEHDVAHAFDVTQSDKSLPEEVITQEQMEILLQRQTAIPDLELGCALMQANIITQDQLSQALRLQGRQAGMPLGDILIDMHAVTRIAINRIWAKKLGMPFVSIREFQFDTEWAKSVAGDAHPANMIMPLYRTATKMVVAVETPFVTDLLMALAKTSNLRVELVMASRDDLQCLIHKIYDEQLISHDSEADMTPSDAYFDLSRFTLSASEPAVAAELENLIALLVTRIISDAISQNVSDIQVKSTAVNQPSQILFRKDGVQSIYSEIPMVFSGALNARIKTLSGLARGDKPYSKSGEMHIARADGCQVKFYVTAQTTDEGLENIVIDR